MFIVDISIRYRQDLTLDFIIILYSIQDVNSVTKNFDTSIEKPPSEYESCINTTCILTGKDLLPCKTRHNNVRYREFKLLKIRRKEALDASLFT